MGLTCGPLVLSEKVAAHHFEHDPTEP